MESPVLRLVGRLKREHTRAIVEEQKRRHELWVNFSALFFAGRGESDAPITKDEYKRRNAKKPRPPTAADWKRQDELSEQWKEMHKTYWEMARHIFNFEKTMRFGGHMFDPPPAPPPPKTSEEIREDRARAFASFRQRYSAALKKAEGSPG